MCGIVGYVGKERCVEVLMEGLKHLEYRGYDSAGLALQISGRIETIKQAGHLARLAEAVAERNGGLSPARVGVGHTRWATHGRPNEVNAHPQLGNGGRVAVVHNGIIENFAELKEELEGRDRRLRHGLPRGPARQACHRTPCPGFRRGRRGERVPLRRPHRRRENPRHRHLPEW